jgi:hypothetical protein
MESTMNARVVCCLLMLFFALGVSAEERKTKQLTTKLSYHISNSSDQTLQTKVFYIKKKNAKVTESSLLKVKPYGDVRSDEAIFYNTGTGIAPDLADMVVRVYDGSGNQIGEDRYEMAPGDGLQTPASHRIDTQLQYLDILVFGGSDRWFVYFLPVQKPH